MASEDNPIVIDDDDDVGMGMDVESSHQVFTNSKTHKHEATIRTFMDILHVNDRNFALSQLQAAGFNLEVAVAHTLEARQISTKLSCEPCENRKRNAESFEENGHEQRHDVSLSTPSGASSTARRKPCFEESNPIVSAVVSKQYRQIGPPSEELNQLSSLWEKCYRNSPTPFVDPDFPPTRASLDGRKESIQNAPTNQSDIVYCYCKLRAAARSVQSDGPNYGRFYLSCGQKNGRRQFTQRRRDNNKNQEDSTNPEMGTERNHKNPKKIINPYIKTKPNQQKTQTQQSKPCNFFQWDKDGSAGSGYNTQWSSLSWHHFGSEESDKFTRNRNKNTFVLYQKAMDPDHVRQGAVGNCWFLSALAVVAEKQYLVQKLVPQRDINAKGCYQINLCLDGKWTPMLVDSNLPVVYAENEATQTPKQARTKSALANWTR